jgi:hypothetical protein
VTQSFSVRRRRVTPTGDKQFHMQRLSKIALALSLPVGAFGCANSGDNETNADDTGAETTDPTTSPTDPTNPSTNPTEPTTSPTEPTTSPTDPDTTDTDPSDTDSTTVPEGCADGDDENSPRMPLDVEITEDTMLTCDTVWVLTAETYVRGATLTIEPGTTIVGQNGSALVIDTDSTINAAGTANAPIIFTSSQPVGSRARQDWGGVVLLGLAEVNLPTGVGLAEGFADPPDYGGTDPGHSCGTLQYVRVEWAGFELVVDNELNAITFYACGTGTTVDHVQAHMGSDDGFEAFGGGFDAKYLIASGNADDAFDFDLGFAGTIQYAFVHQDPSEPDSNHALEWSNGPDNFTATPLTSPWIANLTFVGQGEGGNPGKSIGFNFKQGAGAHVFNAYFTNVTGSAGTFQDEATITVAEDGGIVVEGSFWGTAGAFGHQGDGPYSWDDTMWGAYILEQPGNMAAVDLGLDLTWGAANIKPATDSAAAGAGVDPGNPALDATTYVGAVDPEGDDWTLAAWTNYAT